MLKKIIIPTTLVFAITGATWIYSAHRFEVEAENTLKALSQSTETIKFDRSTINKYFFSITLENCSLNTTYQGKAISYKSSNPQKLSYNPLTKTLSLLDTDLTGLIELKIANDIHTLKYITENLSPIKISFKEHPITVNNDFAAISKNIKQASLHIGKLKFLDAKNDKILSTADGMDFDLDLNVPSTDGDNYHFDMKFASKNHARTKEFQQLTLDIFKSMDAEQAVIEYIKDLDTYFNDKPSSLSGVVAFTAPKGEIHTFADSLSQNTNVPNKELFPTVQLKVDILIDTSSQKSTFVTNINYQKKGRTLKANLDTSGAIKADGQNEVTKAIKKAIESSFSKNGIPLNLSDDEMMKLVPDYLNWNPQVISFNIEGDIKNQIRITDFTSRLAAGDVEFLIKANAEKGNYKGQVRVLNHQKMLTSIKEYSTRFINAETPLNKELETLGYTKEFIQQNVYGILTTADKVFTIIAKAETEAKVPTVLFDVTFNEATAEATINGKSLMEVISAMAQ